MPGPKSTYLRNSVLNHIYGGPSYVAPATLYFALFTTAPADGGSGAIEVAGNAYARVAVTNNSANFPGASAGSKSNANAIVWPTATGPWGTVVSVGIFDAASGGNLLESASILNKTVGVNDTVSIPANGVTLTEV